MNVRSRRFGLAEDMRPPRDEGASRGAAEPLAGVRSPLVTDATRRVADKLRDTRLGAADPEVTASLLAAIALSMDGRRPDVMSTLLPRPSPQLGHQLVDMMRGELLATWTDVRSGASAAAILDALARLEALRPVLERNDAQQLATGLAGPDALDLFVEIVHDLRSPLAAVLFLADTLQRGQSGEVNPLQHRQLGLIYSAALGLSGLVSDALELARGSDELGESEPSPLSLTEVLTSVADIVRPMAEDKGLLVQVILVQPDSRLGHPLALNRVLLNLTTNALKFTEQGYVEISCTARGTSRLEFSVRDTGPGIKPEALEHLYQPFRPARERQGYCFSGTGLGLAITRKLVIAMGGELEYETSGMGTRFYFELDLPVLTSA